MPALQTTIAEYFAELKMTSQVRLLVEGKTDKIALDKLIELHSRKYGRSINLEIDLIERIKDIGILSNRGKIEEIFKKIAAQPFEEKLIGFIDREFNEFSFDPELYDSLGAHKIDRRLVWSRGHSIENYFFRTSILKDSLIRILPLFRSHSKAIGLFETLFEDALRIACAVSLAARRIGHLFKIDKVYERINSTLSDHIIDLKDTSIKIDKSYWLPKLVANLDEMKYPGIAAAFLDEFEKCLIQSKSAPFDVVRWLCHGHIGIAFISLFYLACVVQTGIDTGPDKNLFNISNDMKLSIIATSWAEFSISNISEHPAALFDLIR